MQKVSHLPARANDNSERFSDFPNRREFYRKMGVRLRALRERLGKSPDEFADMWGITARSYLAYERGERTRGWSCYKLYLLGHATKVSLDWLTTGRVGWSGPRNDTRPMFYSSGRGYHTVPALKLVVGGAS